MAIGIGPKLPLSVGSTDPGYTLTKTISENTLQNLKNLVLTSPGERMMNPHFGVGLRRFLFNQFPENTKGGLAREINKQVRRYMPYLRIDKIEFPNIDDSYEPGIKLNHISIRIFYTIKPLSLSNTVDINESLD